MSINNDLILSQLNSAITEAEIENAKKYNLDLTVIKFHIKEDDSQKFIDILKFIDSYFDFMSIVPDTNSTFMLFVRSVKIHATVLMVKNLNLALKLNFGTKIQCAVTSLDFSDDLESFIERLNKFFMKSKITGTELYYGTKLIDYNSSDIDILKKIFEKSNNINIYGLYQEAPIKIEAQVVKIGEGYSVYKVPISYLSFLQKQPILYFEHKDMPDIFTATVMNVDYEDSTIEVGNMKFIDHSPIHRKNLRISPLKAIKSILHYKDFAISGFISDLSANSILFTTEMQNIDKLQSENLIEKTFELNFKLELYGNEFDINVKSTIFRINGNQLVLNIFSNSDTQKIINEYINMSYQQLLLQLQGKVV